MMKKIYILFLVVFMPLLTWAQYQSFLGQNSTEWYYITNSLNPGYSEFSTLKISCQTDSLFSIDSVDYHLCEVNLPDSNGNGSITDSFYIGQNIISGLLLVHELDTTTIHPDTLCNLSLTDSGHYYLFPINAFVPEDVVSIDTFAGSKRIHFTDHNFESRFFQEGVGNSFFFIRWMDYYRSFSQFFETEKLMCQYKDGIKTYSDTILPSFMHDAQITFSDECVTIGWAASIHEQFELNALEIWPNPSSGIIHFRLDIPSHSGLKHMQQVRIFNAQGQLIKSIMNPKNQFSIEMETPGLYNSETLYNGHIYYKRFIVK